MIYITGDTHGDFDRIFEFCEAYDTQKEDILIILGDAGINYFLDARDIALKQELSALPITLFCIHGNHEERPYEINTYEEEKWHGGVVYVELEFPNLIFANDGEIYDFDGRSVLVIGGAYSIDKNYRILYNLPWFETEQPDDVIKNYTENQLKKSNWCVDTVLSHTAPLKFEPTWAFLPNIDQSYVDKSTEKWLDSIENRLSYEKWYFGHYHIDDHDGAVTILYQEIEEF